MEQASVGIRPFRVKVSDEDVAELKARLLQVRWPRDSSEEGWASGTNLSYLKELVDFWAEHYDWRQSENELNQLEHFKVQIEGLDTHFIHQRSPHPGATPLILTHGWPGCIVEFLSVIRRLTHPEEFGGHPHQAFHVVCPSLPGYAWSDPAPAPGMNARGIAIRHKQLMNLLGYNSYIAQGGDWGAMVTRQLAMVDPEHCRAIHLNFLPARIPLELEANLDVATVEERDAISAAYQIRTDGMAYYQVQSSRPQSLAFGLSDSPVGLAGWIVEKFHAWTDCNGDVDLGIGRYRMLSILSLYWFTNTISTSFGIYRAEALEPSPVGYISTPTGVTVYPREILKSLRHWAEQEMNVVQWSEPSEGGHFAAMEQPAVFVEELWRFKDLLDAAEG